MARGRPHVAGAMVVALALVVAVGSGPAVASSHGGATSPCATQSTEADSPLIRDCETLLGLKAELDPDGVLNWAGSLALASWDGVTGDATLGVKELRLENKDLTGGTPAALGGLVSLQELRLSDNELTGPIPPELGNLANLQVLDLSRNQLAGSIPTELGNLINLKQLTLLENELTGPIPRELGNLVSLQVLNLGTSSGYVGNNQLTGSIPPELGSLASLQVLDLDNNRLTGSIPSEIGNLTNLIELDLIGNDLSGSIPLALSNLANLQKLWLPSNELTGGIPKELGDLTNLRRLWLSSNELTGSIPKELGDLTNLQQLWLSGNELTGSIPPELGNLTNLEDLSLSANQLTGSIPKELGDLGNLRGFYASRNQLSGSIPKELGRLSQLSYFEVQLNQLAGSIPEELGNLSQLVWLWLDRNQLTGSIPAELGSLLKLERLQLGVNELTGSIPNELGDLTKLRELSMGSNQLDGEIPTSLGRLTSLKELSLANNRLSGSIPSELGSLTNLQTLWLRGNGLSGSIPSELGNLINLKRLRLEGNELSGPIPPELGNISTLVDLRLADNMLSGSIPNELGSLSSLTDLDLASNDLSGSIPSELGSLASLRTLSASTNELSGAIPTELGNLTSLTTLSLGKNELTGSIPAALGDLSSLVKLGLSCNALSGAVPSELGRITTLTRVELFGNPMLDLDPAAIPTSLADVPELILTGECPGRATPIWSATMTVGSHKGYVGYSYFGAPELPNLGALSPTEFRVGDSPHWVRYLLLFGGELYFGVIPRTGTSFVLNVAGKEFASADAEDGRPQGATWFKWDNPGLAWSVDDQVSASLFLGEQLPNNSAAGAPVISGTAQVGQTLTVDVSGITDADGLVSVSYNYQWLATTTDGPAFGWTHIDGATNSAYELTDADVGKSILVRVSFRDNAHNEESLTSAPTAAVAAKPNPLTGFTLVDASSQPQAVLATLTDGAALTLDDPANGSYGIRVDTEPEAAIGSVRLQLTGARSVDHTEVIAPYSLHGDDGASDLNGGNLPVGSYTLTATAYAAGSPGGAKLGTLTVSFTVAAANPVATLSTSITAAVGAKPGPGPLKPGPHPLTGFTLVDASSQPQTVLASLTDGAALTLDDPANGSYGIRVDTEPEAAIGSVRLQLTGPRSVDHTEGIAPYSLHGDDGASDLNGGNLPVGSYTLTATAYSAGSRGGTELGTLTVSFTVAAANSPATGAPVISGTAQARETLTVSTSGIADANGLTSVSYNYQWLANDAEINGQTAASYQVSDSEVGKTIRVRVSFRDDAHNEESLTSAATAAVVAAPTPLTASLDNEAQSHDGQSHFTFELRFSEHISGLSYVTLRDDAFTVSGGQVKRAKRMDPDSDTNNIHWKITVEPSGSGDVTIVLPATSDCGVDGAICTADGRKLSTRLELTVSGPG